MTKRIMTRILSISMVFAVLFSVTAFPVEARNYAEEIKERENQIDANNSQKQTIEQLLDAIQAENEALQKEITANDKEQAKLDAQLAELDAAINQKQSEIDAVNAEIKSTNQKIEEQNVEISKTYDVLKHRLRASYMAGETSTLEILLSSEDFESFLTRMELVSKVSKHDTDLVKGLEVRIADLKKMTEELEAKKADIESKKATIEVDRAKQADASAANKAIGDSTKKKYEQAEANFLSRNSAIEKLDKNSSLLQKQIDEAEEAQRRELEDVNSDGSTGDGSLGPSDGSHGFKVSSRGMISPLQGNVYISDGFGGSRNHNGIDLCISGLTYGKTIYAAASGKVSHAQKSLALGNYVVIEHGNGVKTTYAHALSLKVSSGQKVSQGQPIAVAGNTGDVRPGPTAANPYAGSHLHFVITINGVVVNPLPYLPI